MRPLPPIPNDTIAPTSLSKPVMARMAKLGFEAFGVVDLDRFSDLNAQRLRDFVANQYHGSMQWMEETLDRRAHPQTMWDKAKTAIVLGYNYGPDVDPLQTLSQTDKATISVYARHHDYHGLIKGKLKELASLVARDSGGDVKVFVDTAPLMEKPLAALAGLGWQGKHTNLVSREFGSWLFLGIILSERDLVLPNPPQDAPQQLAPNDEQPSCGSCRACLDICPTSAFTGEYQLDARKCISYLTIEHKGEIDPDLRPLLGNRIYGCDDCLAVCPWNKFARTAHDIKLQARPDLIAPDLSFLAQLDDVTFRKHFKNSPIKRIGIDQFLRNILYAIGNSGRADLLPRANAHLDHLNPVVKDAARWAIHQITKAQGKVNLDR